MKDLVTNTNNWRTVLIESSHDSLNQYGRSNNLGISGNRDIVQNSDLESVTLILSDIDVKVESREVEECHRNGKSNYGSKNIIIRFINRKCRKKAIINRKQLRELI